MNYPVDAVVISLVDRILRLNSKLLNESHPFLKLLQFMEENVAKSLCVADFCTATHLSESSVNRLCQEHTGTSVMKYFRKIQCWEAERLLRETSLTIQEISVKLGFKNSKSFSTMYRRNKGMSPLENRKSMGGMNNGVK